MQVWRIRDTGELVLAQSKRVASNLSGVAPDLLEWLPNGELVELLLEGAVIQAYDQPPLRRTLTITVVSQERN